MALLIASSLINHLLRQAWQRNLAQKISPRGSYQGSALSLGVSFSRMLLLCLLFPSSFSIHFPMDQGTGAREQQILQRTGQWSHLFHLKGTSPDYCRKEDSQKDHTYTHHTHCAKWKSLQGLKGTRLGLTAEEDRMRGGAELPSWGCRELLKLPSLYQ